MAKQVTFSLQDSLKKLQKSLEKMAPSLEMEVNAAIKDLAYSAYASIVSDIQRKLTKTKNDYLSGLKFQDLGDNNYLISLEGDWPNALEEGFPSFNITTGMLASKKMVSTGERAGEPWVQVNKKGEKYASVPLPKNPSELAAGSSDMAAALKQMSAMNSRGRKQRITSIFKDTEGKPLQGKVAIAKSDNPILDNLTKYQEIVKTKSGKERVKSTYITYRTVSENGRPWIHPGYPGTKSFERAELDIIENIDQIIKTLL